MNSANKHFSQAILLTEGSGEVLREIEALYSLDLERSEISGKLLIKIKHFLESLRSALEYSAQGLAENHGDKVDKSKVAFPYAKLAVTEAEFKTKKYIANKIPGLTKKRPDIEKFILSMQHFSDPRCKWFPKFMELTNSNKHIELTPYTKFEGVQVQIGRATIIAKSISGVGSNEVQSKWDAFLIDGIEWPMTAIEFLRHCQGAISSAVNQLAKL
jgi:hypothetical protein